MKLAIVPIWFVPLVSVAAPVELPDNVPVITVPVSPIVPIAPVAVRVTEPV